MKSTRTHVQNERSASIAPNLSGRVPGGVTLGPVNDPHEQQADQAAERIACGGMAAGTAFAAPPSPRATVQASTANARNPAHERAAPAAAAAVSQGGRSLNAGERAYFEPRFGRDLSHVRLHQGARAARAARDIGARAFTLGNHVGFAAGQYDPHSHRGRHLIAHELAHTLQRPDPARMIRRVPDGFGLDDEHPGRRNDPFAPPSQRMRDPRGPGPHSTLTYMQSRELSRCIEIMGNDPWGRASCANTVLGTPIPDWLSVPGVSSPVPSASRPRAGGGATMNIGPVMLTILPDTNSSDPSMRNKAETTITPDQIPTGSNLVSWVSHGGSVTSFTVHPAAFRLTIQTTYGPGVTAASVSGYGRGTTARDQATGSTSLGFHEGEHGRDFITFLRNNPYPRFRGQNGQSVAVFSARATQFQNALQRYIKRMSRASALATDCVGTTVDQFNAANGSATTTCVAQPGDPTP
ncbi:MAG: DUF4157 domain-containing protein [Ruegeria sp.]|uniref:eCIS core domain-containing protein n=1 Tax=Ruegeria sp. TaxID=1879320 RepID=UPI00349EAD61